MHPLRKRVFLITEDISAHIQPNRLFDLWKRLLQSFGEMERGGHIRERVSLRKVFGDIHPVQPVRIFMEFIITPLMPDVKIDQYAGGDSNSQAYDIDERNKFLLEDIP